MLAETTPNSEGLTYFSAQKLATLLKRGEYTTATISDDLSGDPTVRVYLCDPEDGTHTTGSSLSINEATTKNMRLITIRELQTREIEEQDKLHRRQFGW